MRRDTKHLPSPTVVADKIYSAVPQRIATTLDGDSIYLVYLCDTTRTPIYDRLFLAKHHHEIQGPLNNIANFLQLIRLQLKEEAYDKLYEHIDHALDNITILDKLNNGILRRNINDESLVDLNALVNDITVLCHNQIRASCAQIMVDGNVPRIRCTYTDVLRIFKNLIENSLKHAGAEPLIIQIKLLDITPQFVSILFTDNGAPLSHEQKNFIKYLMIEHDNDVTTRHLGLKICSEIMRKHSGFIRFLDNNEHCSYELLFAVNNEGPHVAP
jgi:light-regulated signal transduction histidine kinase (bacteriophytochrome)